MYRNLEKQQEIIVYGQIDSDMNVRVQQIKIVKFKMRGYKFY